MPMCSAEAAQADEVAPLVGGVLGWAELARALALGEEAASAATSGGQAAELTVLHGALADPVDARIVADALVHWVHGNDFVPLVHGILSDPVGIEHAETAALAAHTLLSDAAQVAGGLPLLDALVHRLSVHDALGDTLLAATTLDPRNADALLRRCP